MSAEQSLQLLNEIRVNLEDDSTFTNLVFGTKTEDEPPAFSISHAQLHQRLTNDFKSISDKTINIACDSHLMEYDTSYKPDSYEIMYFELESRPSIKHLIDSMIDINSLERMMPESDYYNNISFYGIIHKIVDHDLVLLSSITSKNILKKSKKVKLFYSDGFYDRLDTEVLLLDNDIDCFAFNGYMFIKNSSGFHRLSQYHDEVISTANAVINYAALIIPILNLADFKDIGTSDYRMAAKLASIKNKPYLSTLTFDKVRQVIQQHNLPIDIQIDDNGVENLVFEKEPRKRFLILKVLDDDYLHSNMTEQDYAVNSKIQIST